MTLILMFLKSWWKEIAVALIVAAGIFYVENLRSTVADDKVTIGNLTTENKIMKDNNDKLQGALTAQNASLEKIAQGADDTKAKFTALNSSVKSSSANLATTLKGILADKKPQTCQDTITYLLDAVKGYQK